MEHEIYLVISMAVMMAMLIPIASWAQQHRQARLSGLGLTMAAKRMAIKLALRRLNCHYEWTKEGDSSFVHYDFQSGHFTILIAKSSAYARMSYPYIYEAPLSELGLVRNLCNRCNQVSDNVRLVYTVDGEKGNISVHIVAGILLASHDLQAVLSRQMKDMFSWQATFVSRFNTEVEADSVYHPDNDSHDHDQEKSGAAIRHHLQLIHEQEMMHQTTHTDVRESDDHRLTMRTFMQAATNVDAYLPLRLSVFYPSESRQPLRIAADDINDYHISDALTEGEVTHREALLCMAYRDKSTPTQERQLTLFLHAEPSDADCTYYRATLTIMPLLTDENTILDCEDEDYVSLVIAYDHTSDEQRRSQLHYTWKEAMAKTEQGKQQELTDDERTMVECVDRDAAFAYMRGAKLFEAKRYAEAVVYLTAAYDKLCRRYRKSHDVSVERIYHAAYLIGFCYDAMDLPLRAYYYLDILLPLHNIAYTEEYINCMVQCDDPRALGYIESTLQMISFSESDDDDDEPSEGLQHFVNFLNRRKVYLLIEHERYDDAEKLLAEMVDDPENMDFANAELSYLHKKRSKQ